MRITGERVTSLLSPYLYSEGHPSVMYSMLYMTARDEEEAKKLVEHLVEGKLVACGNIFPIRSIYMWRGRLEDVSEVAVIMKTKGSLVERAIGEVKRLHSYGVPCVVSYAMERGLDGYLSWIEESTS